MVPTSCMTKRRRSWQQKLSQIQGVGQVNVGGGALPSVRVDANPTQAGQLRTYAWRICSPC